MDRLGDTGGTTEDICLVVGNLIPRTGYEGRKFQNKNKDMWD